MLINVIYRWRTLIFLAQIKSNIKYQKLLKTERQKYYDEGSFEKFGT